MTDDFFDFLKNNGFKVGVLVDDVFSACKEDISRFLVFEPVNYKLLLALNDGPVNYHELLKRLLIDEDKFANRLILLKRYELIDYEFEGNDLFISAPEINSLMNKYRACFMDSYSNRDAYLNLLSKAREVKINQDNVYYDFPIKGKAIKKVSLTPEYFDLLKNLADKISSDFLKQC